MKKILVTIFLLISFLFVLGIGYVLGWNADLKAHPISVTPSPTSSFVQVNEPELWPLIQKWRTDNGFQPYIKDQRLCDFANVRITRAVSHYDQFSIGHHYLFHEDLEAFFGGMKTTISENAADSITSERTLSDWLASPPHRKALEADYKYSCIATSYPYAVQEFSNF